MSIDTVSNRSDISLIGESIIQNSSWRQLDGHVHAFSTRLGGLGPGGSFSLGGPQPESADFVEQNRRLFCQRLGVESIFIMDQVHGKRVVVVDNMESERVEADGAITQKKNIALTIQTADCLPILLYDPLKQVIGAVHAGWRSAALGIIPETSRLMKMHFQSNPADCHALLGPSIGPCCYEVGEDVTRHFPASARRCAESGRYMLDLWKIARMQLTRLGMKDKHILGTGLCTVHHNDLFFSYRAERAQTGRMMALIMMR